MILITAIGAIFTNCNWYSTAIGILFFYSSNTHFCLTYIDYTIYIPLTRVFMSALVIFIGYTLE